MRERLPLLLEAVQTLLSAFLFWLIVLRQTEGSGKSKTRLDLGGLEGCVNYDGREDGDGEYRGGGQVILLTYHIHSHSRSLHATGLAFLPYQAPPPPCRSWLGDQLLRADALPDAEVLEVLSYGHQACL